jgi:hypothetical protein
MEDRVKKLEDDYKDVLRDMNDFRTRMAVAEHNIADMKADITSIKSNTQWIIRLIIGAMILAIIGFAMQGGFK